MPSTKLGDITLTKQTGTVLTLQTEGNYVATDVSFDLAVRDGAATVTVASTDASIESDATSRNISDIFGTKATTAPDTGYYMKVGASGTGSSTVVTAGWLDAGSLGTASATNSFYFPVSVATATVSGTNTVTPSASVAGTNVTLSNTNNGVSITATGGGTASASVTATGNSAGYAPSGVQIGSGTVAASSETTTATSYISGVTLTTPSSGTNNFSVTLPNGELGTITLTFKVDSTGSWVLE